MASRYRTLEALPPALKAPIAGGHNVLGLQNRVLVLLENPNQASIPPKTRMAQWPKSPVVEKGVFAQEIALNNYLRTTDGMRSINRYLSLSANTAMHA